MAAIFVARSSTPLLHKSTPLALGYTFFCDDDFAPLPMRSFEGPDWGFNSTGAKRATCLRALAQAVEDDKDVSKLLVVHRMPLV